MKDLKKTSIVALTADVLSIDLNTLKEKGFSDFITKPLVIEDLENVLKKYLPIVKKENIQNYSPDKSKILNSNITEVEKESSFSYNLSNVADILKLDIFDLSDIIDEFYLDLENTISLIEESMKEKNFDLLKKQLHDLKGSASNLRFEKSVQILIDMEKYAEDKEMGKIDIEKLKDTFTKYKKIVNSK